MRRSILLIACALEGERSRRRLRASRQHRAGALRRLRPRPPSESARHRPPAGPRGPDGGRRASRSRDRDGEGARAARHDRAARRRDPAVGEPRRARPRPSPRRLRAHLRARSRTRSPNRAGRPLVPGLAAIKRAAVDAGALGCSLSGSGPSLFALCRGTDVAAARGGGDDRAPSRRISAASRRPTCRPIAPQGARVVSSCAS